MYVQEKNHSIYIYIYIGFYIVKFQTSTEGLGTLPPWIRNDYCIDSSNYHLETQKRKHNKSIHLTDFKFLHMVMVRGLPYVHYEYNSASANGKYVFIVTFGQDIIFTITSYK